VVFSWAKLFLK